MFERIGLQKNLGKIKAMVFTPGFIWVQQGPATYMRRATGEGATFWEIKKTRVICAERRGKMAVSSLCHHTERSHSIVLPHTRGVDIGGRGSKNYVVSFPLILKLVEYLVEGCTERAKKPGRIREHFIYRHWKAKVEIVLEGLVLLTRCEYCGMHIPKARLFKHRKTDK